MSRLSCGRPRGITSYGRQEWVKPLTVGVGGQLKLPRSGESSDRRYSARSEPSSGTARLFPRGLRAGRSRTSPSCESK